MLLLLTLASLAFGNPPPAQPSLAAPDTVTAKDQDSLSRMGANLTRIRRPLQERPSYRRNMPFFGPWTDRPYPDGAIDSLLKKNPMVRGPLLRELLIPSDPFADFPEPSALDFFNRRLEQDSKFTPFERMSLIAKRYALYNSSDRSLKSYQLDIRRTIRWWLEEVLK